ALFASLHTPHSVGRQDQRRHAQDDRAAAHRNRPVPQGVQEPARPAPQVRPRPRDGRHLDAPDGAAPHGRGAARAHPAPLGVRRSRSHGHLDRARPGRALVPAELVVHLDAVQEQEQEQGQAARRAVERRGRRPRPAVDRRRVGRRRHPDPHAAQERYQSAAVAVVVTEEGPRHALEEGPLDVAPPDRRELRVGTRAAHDRRAVGHGQGAGARRNRRAPSPQVGHGGRKARAASEPAAPDSEPRQAPVPAPQQRHVSSVGDEHTL
ncbi:uncharacterized protein RHOBADRAFT_51382, partial [Rhodotorula graminis WP1]